MHSRSVYALYYQINFFTFWRKQLFFSFLERTSIFSLSKTLSPWKAIEVGDNYYLGGWFSQLIVLLLCLVSKLINLEIQDNLILCED